MPLFYVGTFHTANILNFDDGFIKQGVWKAFYCRLVDLGVSKRQFKNVFQVPYVHWVFVCS